MSGVPETTNEQRDSLGQARFPRPTMAPEVTDLTRSMLRDAERDAQRIAGVLRLFLGSLLLAVASLADPERMVSSPWPLVVVSLYFALGLASLIVTHPRLFSTRWAPVFVVLDVLWYYTALVIELLVYGAAPNEFATMPVFGVLFVLIALAGMRYTPWALLAGLATFAVLDTLFVTAVLTGAWPGTPPSDDPRFGFGINVFRAVAVMATGLVVGLTSLRARHSLLRAFETRAERDAVRALFGRYLPPSVASEMVASGGALAPKSGTATVLVLDVEGFTGLAEHKEPQELVQMMNAFFRRVEDIIRGREGVVAHFQGDGVLATFNLPVARSDHADRAIDAAIAIDALVGAERFAGVALRVRVGVATGKATAGVVGGADRSSFTVYGDVVNVAARLEQANKRTGTRVLAARSTVDALRAPLVLAPIGPIDLPGRAAAVEVFTPRPQQTGPSVA